MEQRKPQRFIGTVPVHFFFGLQELVKMIEEETLEGVFARHARLGEATRAAVRAWVPRAMARRFTARPRSGSPTR